MTRDLRSDFGQGIMNIAGALHPTERKRQDTQAALDLKREEIEIGRKETLAKLLVNAIKSGSISKEEGGIGLKKLGYSELAGIGPSQKKEAVKSSVQFLLPDGRTEVPAFQKGDQLFYRDKSQKLIPLPYGSTRAPSKQLQGKLSTKLQNTVDDQTLKAQQGLDRLKEIEAGFKPEFTETGTKATVRFNAFMEKTFGVDLGKANKKLLTEYTTFARNTIGNLNQHIRDRTGAVMNAAEIPRMMGEVPVIGDGIFDGDSATQFTAKLKGLMSAYEAAEERLRFVTANGLTPDMAQKDESGNWVNVSTSGYSLDEFKSLPAKPEQFDQAGWDRMPPMKRRRLVELLNKRRK